MIIDKKMSYINWYVSKKEYFLSDNVKIALNKIYLLITKKKMSKSLAIHTINKWMIKNKGIDLGKKYLQEKYNARCAYIHNGKEEFKKWELDFKLKHYGMKKKLCECGCGQEVKKNNRFINGHNLRCRSKKDSEELAAKMRSYKKMKKEKIIQFPIKENLKCS